MSKYPYYAKGFAPQHRSTPAQEIPTLDTKPFDDPEAYRPSKGVPEAVNAALILGRPLLVTGEPGTGKTQLAYSIAHEIGVNDWRAQG